MAVCVSIKHSIFHYGITVILCQESICTSVSFQLAKEDIYSSKCLNTNLHKKALLCKYYVNLVEGNLPNITEA